MKPVPALVVFQTPPEAEATYQVFGCFGSTATSEMRPEVRAGPMLRSASPAKVPALIGPFFLSFPLSSFVSDAVFLSLSTLPAFSAGAAWAPPASRRASRAIHIGARFTEIPPQRYDRWDDPIREVILLTWGV